MRRTLLAAAAVVAAPLLVLAGVALRRSVVAPAPPGSAEAPSLEHVVPVVPAPAVLPRDAERRGGPVAGLDLLRIALPEDDGAASAPAAAGTARLTIDPELERETLALMAARRLPEAAAVLMDVATGGLLVYASRVEKGSPRDLCVEATAPSASVFKIVTAAALVEDARLGPDTRQCWSGGGEQRITAADLVEDPARDRWCTTLAGAMGRSVNAVFARLALERLSPEKLEAMARRFGYGEPIDFDVPVEPGDLKIPTESLEFARTAAGFWNTTLSPLQAAAMSAVVARGGQAVRPTIVESVASPAGAVVWSAPEPAVHRAVAPETAQALADMMEHTVTEGTSRRAFHDGKGDAFLPGITVAGKTGTLADAEAQRYYTWFTGFAPARPHPGEPRQVAVAVLVVNGPTWQVKANVLARDLLRAYFAEHGAEGVTRPSLRPREAARRRWR